MSDEPTTVLVNISEMIDLAIGTPEVGVVDFNMLQTVLHCLAQQLKVLGKNVELRGSVAALSVGRENSQTIAVSEFVVDTKDGQPKDKGEVETMLVVERIKKDKATYAGHPAPTSGTAGPDGHAAARGTSTSARGTSAVGTGMPAAEKLSLVTQSKFNLLEDKVNDLKNRVYGSMPKNEDILEEVRSQTNLKAITDMWTSLNVSSRLEAAENGIGKLSSLVEDLIAAGSDDDAAASALKKAFNTMMSAGGAPGGPMMPGGMAPGGVAPGGMAPGGMAPAGMAPGGVVSGGVAPGGMALGGMAPAGMAPGGTAPGGVATGGMAPGGMVPGGMGPGWMAPGGVTAAAFGVPAGANPSDIVVPKDISPEMEAALTSIKSNLEQQKAEINALASTLYNTLEGLESGGYGIAGAPGAPGMDGAPGEYGAAGTAGAAGAQQAYMSADGTVVTGPPGAPGVPGRPGKAGGARVIGGTGVAGRPGAAGQRGAPESEAGLAALGDKIMEIEKRLKQCCDTIDKRTGALNDKFNSIQDQLDYYLKQGASQASQDLAAGKLSPELIKELQGLMSLFHTVKDMEQQLKKVHDTALQLAAEKENRELNINTLLEQIELLKVIKLDREDMVEAMADKADLRMLARKVSHDQFEMACDDLSKGLELALGKLNLQEALWQQALDDIQREIETKLDKMELSPVKDFFNNKLKQLQENLKQMASLRREAEAAGTKRKLMRDVNCLSCDAQAVMAMETPASIPAMKPLPATLSMKPYLSYELDAIRKSHASNLPQRNMRDWETIDKQMAGTVSRPQRPRSETNKHLCNRYCGGSHTVTTPAQRVARLGHFIKQWGPDVLPLSSGLAAGDDGRMYRISPIEGQAVGPGGAVEGPATPKTPTKKPENRTSNKPLILTNECRCMEGDFNLK